MTLLELLDNLALKQLCKDVEIRQEAVCLVASSLGFVISLQSLETKFTQKIPSAMNEHKNVFFYFTSDGKFCCHLLDLPQSCNLRKKSISSYTQK